MSSWENQVIQSVFSLDEIYRQPLLEMIEVYVKTVKTGVFHTRNHQPQIPVSVKKKAVQRLKELRSEVVLPDDFDPDKELAEAREAKYGSID